MRVEYIQLAAFPNSHPILRWKHFLEEVGIDSYIDRKSQYAVLLVPKENWMRAGEILSSNPDFAPEQIKPAVPCCPNCGASEVLHGGRRYQALALSYLIGTSMGFFRAFWRCSSCQTTWKS